MGSRALVEWGILSECKDIDVISDLPTSFDNLYRGLPTDKELEVLLYKYQNKSCTIEGVDYVVPNPLILKAIYKASTVRDSAKYSERYSSIPGTLPDELEDFAKRRAEEISSYVKTKWFNKYNITRYVEHDTLHKWVKESPSYLKVVKDSIQPSETEWNKLTQSEKVDIIREEAFVLGLERYLLPFSTMNDDLSFLYASFLSEEAPIIDQFLGKVINKGALKDHAEFIRIWAEENVSLVRDGVTEWWVNTFMGLPEEFFTLLEDKNKKPILSNYSDGLS